MDVCAMVLRVMPAPSESIIIMAVTDTSSATLPAPVDGPQGDVNDGGLVGHEPPQRRRGALEPRNDPYGPYPRQVGVEEPVRRILFPWAVNEDGWIECHHRAVG